MAQSATSIDLHRRADVKHALETGSTKAIDELFKGGKLSRIAYAMATARLHYDMRTLAHSAEQCEARVTSRRTKTYLLAALLCSQLARMAELNRGDARAFIEQAQFAADNVLGPLSHVYGRSLDFGNGLDDVDLAALVPSIQHPTIAWDGTGKTLAVVRRVDGPPWRTEFLVPVRIDGRRTMAHLATGSWFRAPVTIVMRSSDAAKTYRNFGLRRVAGHLLTGTRDHAGHAVKWTLALALAKQFVFGPVTVRALGVGVIRSDAWAPGVYLGASSLRWFGEVSVGRKGLVLSKAATGGCAPGAPMTFASNRFGMGRFLFPVEVNGKTFKAAWQPGDTIPFEMKPAAIRAALGPAAIGFSTTTGDEHKRSATVRVGRTILHPVVLRPLWGRWSYLSAQVVMRSWSVGSYRVHLRFGGPQPTIAICVDRRAGESGRRAAPDKPAVPRTRFPSR